MSVAKVALVGDIMCGESYYAINSGVAASLDKYRERFLPEDVQDYLKQHDLVIGNVECVLSDIGRQDNSLRRRQMRGRPSVAGYLSTWGLHVVNLANNHILEHGLPAAVDTAALLHDKCIDTIGTGSDGMFEPGLKTVYRMVNGIPVLIVGGCLLKEKYAYNGGVALDELIHFIQGCKGQIVIVSMHWGKELINRPTHEQKEIAKKLKNAGASIVMGHHPHVLQGVECQGGSLVAYSLGNFIFNGYFSDTTWSIILSVTLSDVGVHQWSYRLIQKNHEHRPFFMSPEDEKNYQREFLYRCELLEMDASSADYQQCYQKDFNKLQMLAKKDLRKKIVRNAIHGQSIFWPQLLWRPIQRRLGLW